MCLAMFVADFCSWHIGHVFVFGTYLVGLVVPWHFFWWFFRLAFWLNSAAHRTHLCTTLDPRCIFLMWLANPALDLQIFLQWGHSVASSSLVTSSDLFSGEPTYPFSFDSSHCSMWVTLSLIISFHNFLSLAWSSTCNGSHPASLVSFIQYLGVQRYFFFGLGVSSNLLSQPKAIRLVFLFSGRRMTCASRSKLLRSILALTDFIINSFLTFHMFFFFFSISFSGGCVFPLHTYR